MSLSDGAGLVDFIVQTGSRVRSMVWLRGAMVGLVIFLVIPPLIQAEEIHLESIGLRGGVSGSSPIGKKETQYFKEYDLMANWSLPWGWYSESGWGLGTRLMGSVGALEASEDTAFIATIVPGVVFGKKDGWISLEVGGGFALLSQHHFANQDMGGAFQFVWDTALRAKVYRGIGVGYWFHHLSDATLYGNDGRGFDLHMIELSYRF
ncbi:MAG: acyloxyacyl hydrolase [Nitrospira sp.]|nr:acyloxyacyl hydrolase [Nitrospira sp.]